MAFRALKARKEEKEVFTDLRSLGDDTLLKESAPIPILRAQNSTSIGENNLVNLSKNLGIRKLEPSDLKLSNEYTFVTTEKKSSTSAFFIVHSRHAQSHKEQSLILFHFGLGISELGNKVFWQLIEHNRLQYGLHSQINIEARKKSLSNPFISSHLKKTEDYFYLGNSITAYLHQAGYPEITLSEKGLVLDRTQLQNIHHQLSRPSTDLQHSNQKKRVA